MTRTWPRPSSPGRRRRRRPATRPPPGAGRGWRCGGSWRQGNTAWAALAELTRRAPRFAAALVVGAVGADTRPDRGAGAAGSGSRRRSWRCAGARAAKGRRARRADRGSRLHRRRGAAPTAARCLAAAGGRGLPLEGVLLRRLTRAELAAGRRPDRGGARRAARRPGHGPRPARPAGQPGPADRDGGAWRRAGRLRTPAGPARRLGQARVLLGGTVTCPVVPGPPGAAARRPGSGGGACRAPSARLPRQGRRAEREIAACYGSGARGPPRGAPASAQAKGSWRGQRGSAPRPRCGGRRRGGRDARRERVRAGEHRRPRRPPARGHDRRRPVLVDAPWRPRRGGRGDQAAGRGPGRPRGAAAPGPAGGGHQGVRPAPAGRARRGAVCAPLRPVLGSPRQKRAWPSHGSGRGAFRWSLGNAPWPAGPSGHRLPVRRRLAGLVAGSGRFRAKGAAGYGDRPAACGGAGAAARDPRGDGRGSGVPAPAASR